ncbi:E3 ubiquitin-protein ligase RNF115-like [Mercenaria mercenaria]|uniref:E3 ubiquitin-protein ligase RNF115-like n=1 Tax=Mercenaria mercenaria TaxID=6596 RepID=UPI00234E3AED|nr:E3 ubiquitin-protein ligase RNF115-like [Mercenaria mercenaria]
MAEAAVENPEQTANSRFYCHQCSIEIEPKLPDFTCPECDNGFIEEISEDVNTASGTSTTQQQPVSDPASRFAELWGRAFLESFSNHAAERDEGVAWARDRDSDDDEQEGSSRRQHRAFQPPRVSFRRTRPIRNQYLQGLFQYFSDRLDNELGAGGGGGITMQGIPVNIVPGIVPLHGAPEDYAWGAGGLDAIITQLLNQLEGSGAPPAQKEKIDGLPVVTITQTQVENVLQCSVCMDDFRVDEKVNKLPCDHHYHIECIVTWLKMHGTCPVCRKDLSGEDTSLKDTITPILDDDSPLNNDSSNGMT